MSAPHPNVPEADDSAGRGRSGRHTVLVRLGALVVLGGIAAATDGDQQTAAGPAAAEARAAAASAAAAAPTTSAPTTSAPATSAPDTGAPATGAPATGAPATGAPASSAPATSASAAAPATETSATGAPAAAAPDAGPATTARGARAPAGELPEGPAEAATGAEGAEPEYAGAYEGDRVGQVDQVVTSSGWDASITQPMPGRSGTACTTVTLTNREDEAQDYTTASWTLQLPTGDVEDATPVGSDDALDALGTLAPGGTVTGDVCWDFSPSQLGQYVFSWRPDLFSIEDRVVWLVSVQR